MRTALVSITVFAVFLLILELLFRLVVYVDKGTQEERYLALPDDKLGWVLNTRMKPKHLENRCGEAVELSPMSHRLILKTPVATGNTRILFLGDSYTHAHEVSTGMAYYDHFERLESGNFEVYAAGVGGYGSVQEFLALEEIHAVIEPDIVVWQLSSNDVGNNVFELDDKSIKSTQRPRPYLNPDDGEIGVRNPGPWLFDWSEGAVYIFKQLVVVDSKYDLGIIDWLDSAGQPDAEEKKQLEAQGLSVLEHVVKRAVEAYPETTIVGFSANPRFDEQYERIFGRSGALYLPRFPRALNDVGGTDCMPLDSHWNHLGNEIAGSVLSERLRQILENQPKISREIGSRLGRNPG